MTVQNPNVKNVYEGNGSTTVFPYTFQLSEEDGGNVRVYITDENDISRRVTNFTIDVKAKTVKYPTTGEALPTGKRITIRREIPAQQELNLENQGPFFAEDIESEFDRLVMMIQQLSETLQRAIVVDMASSQTPQDLLAEILDNLRAAVNAMQSAVTAKGAAEEAANRSKDYAGQSAQSETKAEQKAQEADTSAQNAAVSAGNAANSESAAQGFMESAKGYNSAAEQSANTAEKKRKEAAIFALTAQGWADGDSSPNGEPERKSAKKWAEKAENEANSVADLMNQLQQVYSYDPSRNYGFGMCVMLNSGDVYRCIMPCRGIAPGTDGGKYWREMFPKVEPVEKFQGFNKREFFFFPEQFPNGFTVPVSGLYKITAFGGGGGGSPGKTTTSVNIGGAGGSSGFGNVTYKNLNKFNVIRVTFGEGGNYYAKKHGGDTFVEYMGETVLRASGGITAEIGRDLYPGAAFSLEAILSSPGSPGIIAPTGVAAPGGSGGGGGGGVSRLDGASARSAQYGGGGSGGGVTATGKIFPGEEGGRGFVIIEYYLKE